MLATLGYGDAIGHEVLGIQRVLRGAGFESDIFVQTADPRLEDQTRDYRDLIRRASRQHPDSSLLDRIARLPHHLRAARSRRCSCTTTSRRPSSSSTCTSSSSEQCFKGRRELGIYPRACDLALGDSEFNRQELEALGFNPTGVLPVVPDFSHLDLPPNDLIAREYDDDWTNILFVGRVIPNKRIEDVIRYFHAYQRHFNPRTRLLLVGSYGGFDRYLAMLHSSPPGWECRTSISPAMSRTPSFGLLRRCGSVPLRERPRGLLRSDRRGVPQADSRRGLCRDRGAGDDGWSGRALHTQEPLEVAALDGRDPRRRAAVRTRSCDARTRRSARLRAKDFDGTLLRIMDQVLKSPRKPTPPVAWDFWDQVRLAEEMLSCGSTARPSSAALPERPESKAGLVEEKR